MTTPVSGGTLCRLCAAAGLDVLYDFGLQPVAGYLEDSLDSALRAPRFRNALGICRECGMVQQAGDGGIDILVERVYAEYQPTYSMSGVVQSYMKSFLTFAVDYANPGPDDYVLEIGSNDGAMLGELKRRGLRPVGLDPSGDPEAAAALGYHVIREYFAGESGRALRERLGPAALIFARHTFEHVFEPLDFLRGVAVLLARNGIAIIEVPYLHRQLVNNQFQSMTFQHVSFFTVATMRAMVREAGLELLDVRFSEMDAGSIVAVVGRSAGTEALGRVENLISLERGWRLDQPDGFTGFFGSVEKSRSSLREQLANARFDMTVAFGAGTKGQALLNMLSLDRDRVPNVIDETPGAAGKFVPGVGTAVVGLDDPAVDAASLVLVTAPSHIREVVRRIRTRFAETTAIVATAPSIHFVAPELGS